MRGRGRMAALSAAILTLGFAMSAQALDSDRVQGTGEEVKGKVEQGAGAVTGDKQLQAQGRSDESSGELQDAWGKVKDAVRDGVSAVEEKLHGQ